MSAHAWQLAFEEGDETPSLGGVIYRMCTVPESSHALPAAVRDVVRCLEVINHDVNGAVPSKIKGIVERKAIDPRAIYAISVIQIAGWEYLVPKMKDQLSTDSRQLAIALWAVSFAWSQILDGDIDSLHEELKYACFGQELSLDFDSWEAASET